MYPVGHAGVQGACHRGDLLIHELFDSSRKAVAVMADDDGASARVARKSPMFSNRWR